MPSQQEVKWSQLKVGLIVLVSVALLTTLLFLMTSASGMSLFSRKIYTYSYFENSAGIKVGAPVELEGVTIGEVTGITVTTDPAHKLTPVRVDMRVDPRYRTSLHTDSLTSLSTVGVLGDTVVDIDSKTAVGPELQDHTELKTTEVPNLTDVIKASEGTVESLNVILAKMNRIVDNIETGQGSIGRLINDPTLYNQAAATVNQLNQVAAGLNSGKGTAGKLLTDDRLYTKLDDAVAHLDSIAASLDAGKGTAGKLLKDETLYDNLNRSVAHANSMLAEADAGHGALGLLTHDQAFANKLNDAVGRLDTLLANVNAGKGTLGKLATDDSAYNNLDKLLVSSNDLVVAVRQDPKKYLTIHMRIF